MCVNYLSESSHQPNDIGTIPIFQMRKLRLKGVKPPVNHNPGSGEVQLAPQVSDFKAPIFLIVLCGLLKKRQEEKRRSVAN